MTMTDTIKVLAISGSLRKDSLNTALLRAAQALAPEGMSIEIYGDLGQIPPYDDDVRMRGYPSSVETLRSLVREADALIFATPEYNRSFSGVLKNAIDWVSRPPEQPFAGKVATVMGAGPGAIGTALANYQLRQVLSILGVHLVPGGEVLVGGAGAKFAEGILTDDSTKKFLGSHLAALQHLARRLK
jgi:chromate reductase